MIYSRYFIYNTVKPHTNHKSFATSTHALSRIVMVDPILLAVVRDSKLYMNAIALDNLAIETVPYSFKQVCV